MMWLIGAIGMILALMFTVAIHEAGHMTAAKAFKLNVPEYYVGFGKTLFSKERNGTTYGVKAIPLGGYVKISDPDVEDPDSEEALTLSHVVPWKRQIVYLAGPLVNIVLGTLMFVVFFLSVGFPVPTNVVDQTTCKDGAGVCVAEKAGIKPGDTIVAINGTPVTKDSNISDELTKTKDKAVPVTVERSGKKITVNVTPVPAGERWVMGVLMKSEEKNLTVAQAFKGTGYIYKQNIDGILAIPSKVPGLIRVIQGEKRSDDMPVSVIGATKISGDNAASTAITANDKWVNFAVMVASFNVGIGFINLLPFLPFDGGRMFITFIDSIKMQISRIRKREFVPNNGRFVEAVSLCFGFLLFSYMLLVMFADSVNPV